MSDNSATEKTTEQTLEGLKEAAWRAYRSDDPVNTRIGVALAHLEEAAALPDEEPRRSN